MTELRGWAYLALGGQDYLFSSYAMDPLTLQWEDLLEQWLDQFFEASYTSLLNSNVRFVVSDLFRRRGRVGLVLYRVYIVKGSSRSGLSSFRADVVQC